MIYLLLELRFFADYFWDFKFISIFAIVFLFSFVLKGLVDSLSKGYILNLNKSYCILILLFILFLMNYFMYGGEGSLDILIKVLSIFTMFSVGFYLTKLNTNNLYVLYLPIFVSVFILMITKSGYQYWGDYKTFSGGYYFKTDLAVAMGIFTILYLTSTLSAKIKFLLFIFSFYFVLLSNSRIYSFLFVVLSLFFIYRDFIFERIRFFIIITPLLFLFSFLIIIFLLPFFSELIGVNFLFFNVSEGYSGSNMQGRDLLWENLLILYSDSTVFNKLFGLGLVADVDAAYLTGYFESTNAHNSFLYLLISNGLFGLILFIIFLILYIQRVIFIAENSYEKNKELLFISFSFFILFFVGSFTASVIIYQQLSWFFMLFSGCVFNDKLIKR